MKKIYLLGANSNNEFVFGEIRLEHPSRYNRITGCYEDKKVTNLCICFDIIEIKLTKYSIMKNGMYLRDIDSINSIISNNEYCVEFCSYGQHDTREDGMKEYVDVEAYNLFHELWDNYHLKEVNVTSLGMIQTIAKLLTDTNEKGWILDFIERHKDEFE